MRFIYLFIFHFLSILATANMASPRREGTVSGNALSSRDIEINAEKIYIKINHDFLTAHYTIDYFIRTPVNGKQIPLIFYAINYSHSFSVKVDNIPVKLQENEKNSTDNPRPDFSLFSRYFNTPNTDPTIFQLSFLDFAHYSYQWSEMKYFQTDLLEGTHHIQVQYDGFAWEDRSDWVKNYSFIYALSPAKNWKSFGSLEISIAAPNNNYSTNLGKHENTSSTIHTTWKFSNLPADHIVISYTPPVHYYARLFINFSPTGIAVLIGFLLSLILIVSIKNYISKYPDKKISKHIIIGSLLVPFISLIVYIASFSWIDAIIGAHASNYHGYTFLVFIWYPLLMPAYGFILWIFTRYMKKN